MLKKIFNHKKYKEIEFYNKPYVYLKSHYNSVIPLNIFQTWSTKKLPSKMKERVDRLKSQNPEFTHYLFDDNDCREFIKDNFSSEVLNAYDTLIPGAYKADLWRLCVLYIHGGIYMDIKLNCINGFKLIELTEKNHYTQDIQQNPFSIYNAFMICQPNTPFLIHCIYNIIVNAKNHFYGKSALAPTGPYLLGKIIKNNKFNEDEIDLLHYRGGGYIIYKDTFIISTTYPEYHSEQREAYSKLNAKVHYSILWNRRSIYK
jgi:mannosyltransferase OCH1-like enzyme